MLDPYLHEKTRKRVQAKAQKKRDTEAAKKNARREAMEAERLGRLERLKQMTEYPRTGPRWMFVAGRWSWHEWSQERGGFADTGVLPVPGTPLAQQRGR